MAQNRFNQFMGDLPSQQVFAAAVILLWIATGTVMLCGKSPAEHWLDSLNMATFAGVLHYGVKRFSFKKPDGSETTLDNGTP